MRGRNSQPTLEQFIAGRLGENQSPEQLLRAMLVRSFGAASFDQFWRYWNPVYGHFLLYRCYLPLRRFLPRPLAVVLTFAASGFLLHDLPFGWWVRLARFLQGGPFPVPFVTLWFSLMALLVVLSSALRWDWSRSPTALRVTLNSIAIIVPFAVTLGLTRLLP